MSNPNYKNSNKHKAQHGNYREKPTQQGVNALMSLYEGVAEAVKPKAGTQTKLEFK